VEGSRENFKNSTEFHKFAQRAGDFLKMKKCSDEVEIKRMADEGLKIHDPEFGELGESQHRWIIWVFWRERWSLSTS
jgi:hypothetical protein